MPRIQEPEKNSNGREQRERWRLTREKILMAVGLSLIISTFATAELGLPFHYEFLIGGLALCGISIAQWGDHL